jgi:hypothetical protein
MTDGDERAAKRVRTWLIVLLGIGALLGAYLNDQREVDIRRAGLPTCMYNPNTGETFPTPCVER